MSLSSYYLTIFAAQRYMYISGVAICLKIVEVLFCVLSANLKK